MRHLPPQIRVGVRVRVRVRACNLERVLVPYGLAVVKLLLWLIRHSLLGRG